MCDKFAKIVAAVNATKGLVEDDHRQNATIQVTGIGNLVKGDEKIPVIFCDSNYFSLNLLYLGSAGEPRVCRNSVGGCVELFGAPLEQGILAYNESQIHNILTSTFLTDIHYLVDGQLVAVDLVPAEKVAEMQATVKQGYDVWKTRMQS